MDSKPLALINMNTKQQKREKKKAAKTAWAARKVQKRVDIKVQQFMARYPLQMVKAEARENPCGECQACCEAISVHELDKPMWQRCEHQCESGCGIYNERPSSCQKYYCLWQAGILKGGVENRPDNLGIILDFRALAEGSNVDAISAWEMREGAADEPRVKEILDAIGKRFIVCVRRYRSSKLRFIDQPVNLLAISLSAKSIDLDTNQSIV